MVYRPGRVFGNALEAIERRDRDGILAGINVLDGRDEYASHVKLLRAAYLLQENRPADAMQSLHGLNPEGDLREPALLLTGECLFHLKQLPLAARQFQQLLEDGGRPADAHRWLGQIFYNLGAFDIAFEHLRELVKIEKDNFLAYALMGHMAYDFEDYEVSVKNYKKALSLSATSAIRPAVRQEVLRNLAQSHIGQLAYRQALKVLAKSDRDDSLVLALEADCHRGLGDSNRASRLLSEALRQNPRDRKALLVTVTISLEAKRPEEAIGPLSQLLEDDPHDTAARFLLAQVYGKLDRTKDYQREIKLRDASNRLKNELTEKNLIANQNPRDAAVRNRLAEICRQLGKHDLAVMWQQAAEACRQAPATNNPLPAPGTPMQPGP